MSQPSKVTPKTLSDLKAAKRRFACVAAYDAPSARIAEAADIEVLLVGDSVGTTVQGLDVTVPVTLDDMIYHTEAVRRGVQRALLVADLPHEASQGTPIKIAALAQLLIKEGGAEAVKIEGPAFEAVRAMVTEKIPVMGHLGLLPQTALLTGGLKVRAKSEEEADKLLEDAKSLEKAGVFALVLECIPWQVGKRVTQSLRIPTIGIGAGPGTDAQILVWHDLLGFQKGQKYKFVRRYMNFAEEAEKALKNYKADVLSGSFPSFDESFAVKKEEAPRA